MSKEFKKINFETSSTSNNEGFAWTAIVIVLFIIGLVFTLNSRFGFINAGTLETLSPYINRELNEYNESDFVVETSVPATVTEPEPTIPNSSPTQFSSGPQSNLEYLDSRGSF